MFDKIHLFWEDQHPLTRSNLSLGICTLAAGIALHGVIRLILRGLGTEMIYSLSLALRMLHTVLLLLMLILIYNALRLLWQFLQGKGIVGSYGVLLAFLGIIILGGAITVLPNVISAAIAATAGRSYGSVYHDFEEVCDRWVVVWKDAENITLDVSQEDLGRLGQEAEVFRLRNTVIFNFSDQQQDFGLACVLDQTQPADSGRAQPYEFFHLGRSRYQFAEKNR